MFEKRGTNIKTNAVHKSAADGNVEKYLAYGSSITFGT